MIFRTVLIECPVIPAIRLNERSLLARRSEIMTFVGIVQYGIQNGMLMTIKSLIVATQSYYSMVLPGVPTVSGWRLSVLTWMIFSTSIRIKINATSKLNIDIPSMQWILVVLFCRNQEQSLNTNIMAALWNTLKIIILKHFKGCLLQKRK